MGDGGESHSTKDIILQSTVEMLVYVKIVGGGTAAAASAVLAAVTFFNDICRASFPAIITQVDNTNVCMWMNNEIRIIRAVSGLFYIHTY
mgnify:CR=1 FL=1